MLIKYLKGLKAGYIGRRLEKMYLIPYKLHRKDPTSFGNNCYCIVTNMSKHKIYIHADEIIIDNGALKLIGAYQGYEDEYGHIPESPQHENLIIAPGLWKFVYLLANCHAAAVSMWEGEVDKYHG